MTGCLRYAFTAALIAIAIAPACSAVQPEVGERLPLCVNADSNTAVAVDFKAQIRPLMAGPNPGGPRPCENCHYHSSGSMEGLNATRLDLESLGSLKKGGNRTLDIVVPGKPCDSAIVKKLRGTFEGARMPKGGPYWTPEQIQLMTDWIFEGAKGADTD